MPTDYWTIERMVKGSKTSQDLDDHFQMWPWDACQYFKTVVFFGRLASATLRSL